VSIVSLKSSIFNPPFPFSSSAFQSIGNQYHTYASASRVLAADNSDVQKEQNTTANSTNSGHFTSNPIRLQLQYGPICGSSSSIYSQILIFKIQHSQQVRLTDVTVTCLEDLRFWMSSIVVHTADSNGLTAWVTLVETSHGAQLDHKNGESNWEEWNDRTRMLLLWWTSCISWNHQVSPKRKWSEALMDNRGKLCITIQFFQWRGSFAGASLMLLLIAWWR
jgi:hypothetical protein